MPLQLAQHPMNSNDIQTVAVLGAGTMGAQIAFTCAGKGYAVALMDKAPVALETARARHNEWASREIPDAAQRAAVLARIRSYPSLEKAVSGADLVIECLPEDLELKRRVFGQLDDLCAPEVVLATNSSSLRVSRIETDVKRRERVCNLHFTQRPSTVIEIMGGSVTPAATLEVVRRFATSLGLRPFVLQRESTGFLYNRIWRAIKKEVLREVAEGVASPEDIDRIIVLLWGWEKGPFAWMDQVGLDVVRDIERVYFEESGDPKDKPPAFLDEMIARGEQGVKTGKGFYTYPQPAFEDPSWLTGKPGAPSRKRGPFIGTWRLVSFEAKAEGRATFPFGEDATGMLTYSSEGRMSVILSRATRARFETADSKAGTMDERAAAFDSCFAYGGTFEVGEGKVIHRIEQCTHPNWVGTDQVRFYHFEGGRLILETPPMPMEGRQTVSRLVWERASS
jgi:3-hydroxybutyryl-CoA dehydrogenase